jgi:Cu/Zn superoxide dismutase
MKKTINRFGIFLLVPVLALSLTQCTKDVNRDSESEELALRSNKSLNQSKTYTANLGTLNNSGVTGTATLTLDGNMLTVHVMATGLEPNQLHIQHIHGFMDNKKKSMCPPQSADMNGDGFVDLVEGLPFYGGVLLDLEPFPTAPDGTINYTQTFTIDASLLPLQNRVVVIHGLTVNGMYDVTMPVACGMIR